MKIAYLFFLLIAIFAKISQTDLNIQLEKLVKEKSFMGFAIEISENDKTIYKANFGLRDLARNLQIDNNTMFRMASLSKSMTAAGLVLLVEQGKLQFTDTLQKIFGFRAVNPNFPNIPITVEMILSHQSSLIECSAYDNFLSDTYYNSKSGADIPHISTLFIPGAKYFNDCTFSKTHKPGDYYQYVNLNFLLAGTIIQKLSGQRFDLYMKQHIFSKFSQNMNFNPAALKNPNDLAVLYTGNNGKWVVAKDDYNGTIPDFNMTGYAIGTNAGYYGPQGSVRASVTDLIKFSNILKNKGLYNGSVVIPQKMVNEMIRPRYQFHGTSHGALNDFHAYGTGLFSTTYRQNDNVWYNRFVVGHIGDAYGLASAYWYSGNYSVAYAISGALYGYHYDSTISHFSLQRQKIANLTASYLFD